MTLIYTAAVYPSKLGRQAQQAPSSFQVRFFRAPKPSLVSSAACQLFVRISVLLYVTFTPYIMPAAAPIQMKTCSLCKESFCDLPQSGRCNECQSLKTRLYRQFAKTDSVERRQWDSLTKEQRQVFYAQWHGQVGIDLKAAIKESMVESITESQKETSELQFNWLDDYELKKNTRAKRSKSKI